MIYYDSKTGNTEKFVNKVAEKTNEKLVKVDENTKISETGHFVTYTIGKGELSSVAKKFLANNKDLIISISSSGGIEKHPDTYGFAIEKATELYPNIKKGIRFNKEGTDEDVTKFIEFIK